MKARLSSAGEVQLPDIGALLRASRHRLFAVRCVRAVSWAALVIAMLILVARVAVLVPSEGLSVLRSVAPIAWLALLAVVVVVTGLTVAIAVRVGLPGDVPLAHFVDRTLGLDERLGTALEVALRGERGIVVDHLLQDAERCARRSMSSVHTLPFRRRRSEVVAAWATVPVLVLAAAVPSFSILRFGYDRAVMPESLPTTSGAGAAAATELSLADQLRRAAELTRSDAERTQDAYLHAIAAALDNLALEASTGAMDATNLMDGANRLSEHIARAYGTDPSTVTDLASAFPEGTMFNMVDRVAEYNPYGRSETAARGFTTERDPGDEDFTFVGDADRDVRSDAFMTEDEIAERDERTDGQDRDTAETARADQRRRTNDFYDDPYAQDTDAVLRQLERLMSDAPQRGDVAMPGAGQFDGEAGFHTADLFADIDALDEMVWLEADANPIELTSNEASARRIRISMPPSVRLDGDRGQTGPRDAGAWRRATESAVTSFTVDAVNRQIASKYFAMQIRQVPEQPIQ